MTTRLEQAFTEASSSHQRNKMPWQIGYLLNSALRKNGIDYSPILKRNYLNYLLKHLPNIIVDKRWNSIQTNYEFKNDKTLPSDADEITRQHPTTS